jgi:hypothetical protein
MAWQRWRRQKTVNMMVTAPGRGMALALVTPTVASA